MDNNVSVLTKKDYPRLARLSKWGAFEFSLPRVLILKMREDVAKMGILFSVVVAITWVLMKGAIKVLLTLPVSNDRTSVIYSQNNYAYSDPDYDLNRIKNRKKAKKTLQTDVLQKNAKKESEEYRKLIQERRIEEEEDA